MDELPVNEMTEDEHQMALSISNVSLRGKGVQALYFNWWFGKVS